MSKKYFLIPLIIFLISNAFAEIEFTPKMLHDIKIMEKRHFKNSLNGEPNEYRLERLEMELTGRTWERLPLEERMKYIKLASQKKMLSGVSMPSKLNHSTSAKKMDNDSVEVLNENDVGLIDGFLKLLAPDLFECYRATRAEKFERWEE